MLQIDWKNVDSYEEDEISYYLFVEGKSMDAISKIRGLNRDLVQSHIISGKIKYRILAKSKDEKDIFNAISKLGKLDKIEVIKALNQSVKYKLFRYVKENYTDMLSKEKEFAVWLLGEIGSEDSKEILFKASVHNHVNVRRMAISAMGKIGSKEMETALIKALEDENPQVVMYAMKSLMKIESKAALNKVKAIKEKTLKPYLKAAAENYINSLEE